jgi:hypothetical protein
VRTTDGGHTWKGIPAPRARLGVASDDPAAPAVTTIRFANDRDGFAFGNVMWTTHDGGADWRQLPDVAGVSPYSVSSLAVTPAGVYAVVQYGGHAAHFDLVRADASGDKFSIVHDFGPDSTVETMTPGGSTVYVVYSPPGSDTGMLARVSGTSIVSRPLPSDPTCTFLPLLGPSSASDLLLACGSHQAQGGQGTRALYGSTNGGDAWTSLPDPGRGGGWITTGVADAGGGHAVLATSDAGGASLLVTTDGTQHWAEKLHMDNTGGAAWGDLGFENRSTGVVVFGPGLSSPGMGVLYRTTDGGVTWSKVSFSA